VRKYSEKSALSQEDEVGILLLTDVSREENKAAVKEQLETRKLKAEM